MVRLLCRARRGRKRGILAVTPGRLLWSWDDWGEAKIEEHAMMDVLESRREGARFTLVRAVGDAVSWEVDPPERAAALDVEIAELIAAPFDDAAWPSAEAASERDPA
jgi:hypothetical protein